MSVEQWGIFVLTLGVATLLPGPSVLLALHNGLRYGRARSLAGILGVVVAALILAGAAMTGLAGLLLASAHLFRLLRLAGAAYLIFLGARMLWSSRRAAQANALEREGNQLEGRELFRQGVRVGLSNPKAILFFGALFPQFLDAGRASPLHYAAMLATLAAVVFLCLLAYASGGSWLAGRVGRGRLGPWSARLAGVGYVSLGGCFALTKR